MSNPLNIADRLRITAEKYPYQNGVVFPEGQDSSGRVAYTHLSFQQLNEESDKLASGLIEMGVRQGHRLVLMVRPSLEFIALTFALFKTGATVVLIDPGMGRKNIFKCLAEVVPDGFVAIPPVHWVRRMSRGKFPNAKFNVVVGKSMLAGCPTYEDVIKAAKPNSEFPQTHSTDSAAIIFTSGSTGAPKGVQYEHGMFDAQVDLLRDRYQIEPGEIDLPGFPLFALFNAAMGVTTVIPDMDPTKPAKVDPLKIIEAIEDHGITQAFGSPAFWNQVGRYCEKNNVTFPTLRRALSAGAPVPNHVLKRVTKMLTGDQADIFTPYGATEALPVCSISGSEVLERTQHLTDQGAGTCVGQTFPKVSLKIIEISDKPIENISDAKEVERGEIGEIIVQSPSATRAYFKLDEATKLAKISDGENFWHRMGDVGYLTDDENLWFCGRKAHIVEANNERLFPVRCEAIFNTHSNVYRSALVGVGDKPMQTPVLVVEPEPGCYPNSAADKQKLIKELLEIGKPNEMTAGIETILFKDALPVDRRHNVKIHREELSVWATSQIDIAPKS